MAATGGAVELVKVNVDDNPRVSATFQVQSIPAVYALKDGKVVDGFVGALPEAAGQRLRRPAGPGADRGRPAGRGGRRGVAAPGPRARARPPRGVVALARLLSTRAGPAEALEVLARIPETADIRALAAEARLAASTSRRGDDVDAGARRSAAPGEGRRGRPPGVPRPARDAGRR